jgi:hypothetical protein
LPRIYLCSIIRVLILLAAQPPNLNGSILTAVALALWLIAVLRSPRKGHTFLFILACMVGGLVVGGAIGWFINGPEAAGAFGALATQFSGIAAAINRMVLYRKSKQPKYAVK